MTDQRVEENPRKTTNRIADRCRQRADEVDDEASFLLRRAASIIEHQSEQIDDLKPRLEAAEAVVEAAGEVMKYEDSSSDFPLDKAFLAEYREAFDRLRTALEEYDATK